MTPSPTPSEGDMLRRAAAQSSGVREQTIEECAKVAEAEGYIASPMIAKKIRALSPDTSREGKEKEHG